MAFDFEMMYKAGSTNKVVDALSRKCTEEIVLSMMLTSSVIDWTELFKEIERDEFITRLKKEVIQKNGDMTHFSVFGGRLLYK